MPLPTLTPTPKTEDDTITVGNYCESLLKDDTFNLLYDEFKREHVDFILGTTPGETIKREQIYAEMHGASAFLAVIRRYVDVRDQIIERREAVIDPDAA